LTILDSIVAVHGLNGHPFKTWTTEKTKKFWLKDTGLLPSTLKSARILTFGYNAAVAALLGRTSSDRILQHAQTLVAELVADREVSLNWSQEISAKHISQLEDASQRPIIFICHSLGGIVVKRLSYTLLESKYIGHVLTLSQALAYSASRTSKLVQHVHSIFVSTYGILFLGTPHNGSSKAGLASVGSRMINALTPSKVVDTDSQLADALHEGSEILQNITDMFAPLMKNFRIYFFWEQEKTNLGTTLAYVCDLYHPLTIRLTRSLTCYRLWMRIRQLRFLMIRKEPVYRMGIGK
jgi:hypothetical protein